MTFIPVIQGMKAEGAQRIKKAAKKGLRLAGLKWDQDFDMIM